MSIIFSVLNSYTVTAMRNWIFSKHFIEQNGCSQLIQFSVDENTNNNYQKGNCIIDVQSCMITMWKLKFVFIEVLLISSTSFVEIFLESMDSVKIFTELICYH